MRLGRVIGKIVATTKDEKLNGKKILIVQPIDVDEQDRGEELVAIDSVGAGVGDVVLTVRGSVARYPFDGHDTPTDSTIVAIVDSIEKR